MYWVPYDISHLQFLESLSTHIVTFNKSQSQQLVNTYSFAEVSGKKISNGMLFCSFYSRIYLQRRPEILDF